MYHNHDSPIYSVLLTQIQFFFMHFTERGNSHLIKVVEVVVLEPESPALPLCYGWKLLAPFLNIMARFFLQYIPDYICHCFNITTFFRIYISVHPELYESFDNENLL